MLSAIRRFTEHTKREINRDVRAVQLALFSSIIRGTPVDSGRARGNWQTSIGTPVEGTVERLDQRGTQAIAEVRNNMGEAGQVTWLTNNLPYIGKLEYGGYGEGPNTVGGFSKQAPAGMVRVNMARVAGLIEEIVRRGRR
jgi:hypothetical protein